VKTEEISNTPPKYEIWTVFKPYTSVISKNITIVTRKILPVGQSRIDQAFQDLFLSCDYGDVKIGYNNSPY